MATLHRWICNAIKLMKKKIIRSLLLTFSVLPLSQNCFNAENASHLSIKKNAFSTTTVDYSLTTSSINDVYQNSYSNIIYVYASSLENINSLSIEVHYSSNNIEISSINNSVTSLMYDSSIQSDSAKITYLLDTTVGTSEKTTLFSFYFNVKETASIGGDYFDILVTEAYDSTLNSVEFKNVRTSFGIKEKQQSKECNIYSQLTGNNAKISETVSVNYYTYDYDIESASFVVTYDDELLSFESIDKGSYLDDKIVDINSSYKGSIYLSFASSATSSSSDLFTIKLKVLKNTTATTKIELTPSELYDSNLNLMSSSKVADSLNIVEDENYVADKPSIKLSSSLNSSKQVSLKVSLEENMHLGAGDFAISFDKGNLTYVSSNKLFSPSFFNINEKELSDGVLKFSIINLTDIVDALDILEVIFTPKLFCEQSYQISFDITGSGIADSLTNSIVINYINCSQIIERTNHPNLTHHSKVEPTCLGGGTIEYYSCDDCGKLFADSAKTTEVTDLNIAPTGHSFGDWVTDAEATCERDGTKHRVCSSCGYSESVAIPAPGHDLTHHGREEPTCTECGHEEYDECSRCGYTTYVEIPVLGHNYQRVEHAPTCTEGGFARYVCSRCGDVDGSRTESIVATGHSFGDWIIDAEATKNSEGKMHRVCKTCGYEEFQSIKKLDGFNKTHLILAISLPAVVIAGSALVLFIVRRKRKNK